ncbi:hypothetical protein OROGR_017374 [Orobanche gracilis]
MGGRDGGGFRGGRDGGGFRGGRDGGGRSRGGRRFSGGGRSPLATKARLLKLLVSTFLHASEGDAVTKLTNEKIPYFNAPVYLQNKTQIGKVDEIFGPINESYFSVKMMEGIVATSYSPGDKFFIDPAKLLPLARFLSQPKRQPQFSRGGGRGGGRGAGRGSRGGFRGKGGPSRHAGARRTGGLALGPALGFTFLARPAGLRFRTGT